MFALLRSCAWVCWIAAVVTAAVSLASWNIRATEARNIASVIEHERQVASEKAAKTRQNEAEVLAMQRTMAGTPERDYEVIELKPPPKPAEAPGPAITQPSPVSEPILQIGNEMLPWLLFFILIGGGALFWMGSDRCKPTP